jgi:hypothetical protein
MNTMMTDNRDIYLITFTGADPGFQVRGAHLKKMRRAEGGAKNFGVFRVKKITILRQKILFFPILGGGSGKLIMF